MTFGSCTLSLDLVCDLWVVYGVFGSHIKFRVMYVVFGSCVVVKKSCVCLWSLSHGQESSAEEDETNELWNFQLSVETTEQIRRKTGGEHRDPSGRRCRRERC